MAAPKKRRTKKADIGYGYDSIFPTQLRKLLDRPGMTQQQLADHLGVSRQSIAQWKDGKTAPEIYYIKEIAEFFGVAYEYLFDGGDNATYKNIEIGKELGLSDVSIDNLLSIKELDPLGKANFAECIISQDEFVEFSKQLFYLVTTREGIRVLGEKRSLGKTIEEILLGDDSNEEMNDTPIAENDINELVIDALVNDSPINEDYLMELLINTLTRDYGIHCSNAAQALIEAVLNDPI